VSAQAVRTAFRAKVAGLLAPDGFAYFESVNRAESTQHLPPNWYTLEFPPASDTPISLGRPTRFRESGQCRVAIYTPHQTEDTAGVDAAEKVRAEMSAWFDPTGMLHVLSAQPPMDIDSGDFRGSFYGIAVDLVYQFDRFA
jgi:hypothetical protein